MVDAVYIHIIARENEHLSDLPIQDSYSFELAEIFIGAQHQHSLLEKYKSCIALLPFVLEPVEKAHAQMEGGFP